MAFCKKGMASAVSYLIHRRSLTFQQSAIQILAVQKRFEDGRRHLFSSEILGLENYARQKSALLEKTGLLREKFFKRMEDYMTASDSNTIFTDDLKTMVYFTEADSELETGVKMLKRFHSQNSDLRFSSFVFGPLIMRLLHIHKKPDIAFQLFTDKSLEGMFDQMSSFIVLMDLLYENRQYERILEVMEIVKSRQLNGMKYPTDCVTLTIAACYQMNTPKSLDVVMSLLKELKDSSVNVSMRSTVYAAMLALKQGRADVALEMLSVASIRPGHNLPVAYVNAKLLILSALDRAEDAVGLLKAVVQQDVPDHVTQGNEVFKEVVEKVREAVTKNGSKELQHQLTITEKALQGGNHIAMEEFVEYLERPILRQRRLQDGFKQRQRMPVGGFKRLPGKQSYRPGLLD